MDWSKSVCESPKWLIPTVVICSWFCWLMVHCLLLTPSFTLAACWIIEPWYHCFRRNPCYPRWRHCHQSAPQFWLCTCGTGWTYRLFKEQTRIILGDLVQVNLQNRGTPVTTMGCTISLCLCFFDKTIMISSWHAEGPALCPFDRFYCVVSFSIFCWQSAPFCLTQVEYNPFSDISKSHFCLLPSPFSPPFQLAQAHRRTRSKAALSPGIRQSSGWWSGSPLKQNIQVNYPSSWTCSEKKHLRRNKHYLRNYHEKRIM